ncbi:hypothetical protein [Pseudomonas gingeri]|nr:hypothetical protein [Pseudomonas gingeri]NWD52839.1 hypothetical protein [Pseudomonas gingeri]
MNITDVESSGWDSDYSVVDSYKAGGKEFLYCYKPDTGEWFTRYIDGVYGKIGMGDVRNGVLERARYVQFIYTVQTMNFLYLYSEKELAWSIRRLNDDGSVGDVTDYGVWSGGNIWWHNHVCYWVDDKLFVLLHNIDSQTWMTYELLSNGTIDRAERASGTLERNYTGLYACRAGSRSYLYAQTSHYEPGADNQAYTLRVLTRDGTLGQVTEDAGFMQCPPKVQIFTSNGKDHLFGYYPDSGLYFAREIMPGGTVSTDQVLSGYMEPGYGKAFKLFSGLKGVE